MDNEAINELIRVLTALTEVAEETSFKVKAAEAMLKTTNPDLYRDYQKYLQAFRDANRGLLTAVADQSIYDKLRSALRRDQE